jgi:glycosyltransferase involved in cell wall biosynthesis
LNAISPNIESKPKKPDYSVILPVYREEKILEAILSKYSPELQRKYNFELIVSDGGSNDKSVEIAGNHTSKIAVHTEARRQTIAEGRNRGAELAEGDVFIFINSDTYPADPETFFQSVQKFDIEQKDTIALSCRVRGFPEEEDCWDRIFYSIHNPLLHLGNLLNWGFGRGECQVVRREAFEKVGGYNKFIRAGEDFDLYRRLVKIGKIRYSRDIFVYESTRRFKKYGYVKVLSWWIINALAVKFKGHAVSEDWEAVR